jgi:uncharacterized protein YoaH (UPF0181 family)
MFLDGMSKGKAIKSLLVATRHTHANMTPAMSC